MAVVVVIIRSFDGEKREEGDQVHRQKLSRSLTSHALEGGLGSGKLSKLSSSRLICFRDS